MMTDTIADRCLKIDVCKMEGCNYRRKVDLDDELMISVAQRMSLSRIFARHSMAWMHDSLEKLPIRLTLSNLGIMAVMLAILMPRSFTYMLVYPIFRLVFGTLYPAYASYKAVRTKNVKEYVKWMMYWIVFALFTCAETFTDVFFSFWFPFYYEIKIILVLWLLSPATKGSSILYRRFVHPALSRREAEIDEALARATEQGYTAVLHLGSRGVNYATTVLMQTAIKGGGGLVQQLRKSYSLSDLTGEKEDENRNTPNTHDETDMEVEPRRRERVGRRGYSPRRTQSTSNRVEMYFSEVDVEVRQPRPKEPLVSLNNIRSSEDISSGYSSGEALHNHRLSTHSESLVRTASVGGRTRVKPRSTTKKAPEEEEEDSDNNLLYPDHLPLPDPLTFLNAAQALELLSFLSHYLACNNYIKLNKDFSKAEDFSGAEEKGSNVEFFISEEEDRERKIGNKISIPSANIAPKIVKSEVNEPETGKKQTVEDLFSANKTTIWEKSSTEIDMDKLTDELCKERFDQLKKLLSDAHKAASNIVSSEESLSKCDTVGENVPFLNYVDKDTSDENNLNQTYGSISSFEVWSTPSISRSNSDTGLRAGKYYKKPAPKAPTSKCAEDLEDTESQKALKATLVIKTGTLKSFIDSGDSQKSKRRKTNKSRPKDGFSKLLTIPKNFFHSAFHKDQKQKVRYDDTSSIASDCSDSRSRSSSTGSQNPATDDNTLTTSTELDTEKYISKNERAKTEEEKNDSHDLDLQNTVIECAKIVERSDEDLIAEDKKDLVKNEKSKTEGAENSESIGMYRARLKIRQMSRSPTRGPKKTLADEYN